MSKVLVLDDRIADRELLVTVLTYAGHDVVDASSASEALANARAIHPDLIITDLLMPDVSGDEFVRLLRTEPSLVDTKVIFCTATYAEDEVTALADGLGVARVLVKPCEPKEIIAAVDEVLSSSAGYVRSSVVPEDFDREQLRVVNDKLVQKVSELERAGERLRQAEHETAESLSLLETLLSRAPIGFAYIDRDRRLVRINETFARAIGVDANSTHTLPELLADRRARIEPLYEKVLETGEAIVNQEVEAEAAFAPGEIRHWLVSYYPVLLDGELTGVGIVTLDVTERREADTFRSVVMQTMAEGLFVTDGEDQLVYLNDAASKLLGWTVDELRGQRVHGAIHHQTADGSSVPESESERLRVLREGRTVRVLDDSFTRKDGSIFPVAYSATPLMRGGAVRGSVVVFRDATTELTEQSQVDRELAGLAWVGRIRDAIDEDRLVLFAQPICPLTGGTQTDELLLRMRGHQGELVPPGSFLPIAERYKLIAEVDRWVLGRALDLAAQGRYVHVNLSADSLARADLPLLVERELKRSGADPAIVVFEVTETALLGDLGAGEACARGLAELGCAVALDDFGTGYASLSYLQKLPVQYLKIDITFIRDLIANPANMHVVEAIVHLAQSFGQKTIAEGVEDAPTLELVRRLGVDYAQGFHLGRPQPLSE